jgi:hypothetical protein
MEEEPREVREDDKGKEEMEDDDKGKEELEEEGSIAVPKGTEMVPGKDVGSELEASGVPKKAKFEIKKWNAVALWAYGTHQYIHIHTYTYIYIYIQTHDRSLRTLSLSWYQL